MLSAENLAAIESEGRRLGYAARRDPARPVPFYEGWALADLAAHTASIHGRTTLICKELPTERISAPRLPEGADPIDWYEETLEEMLGVLTETDPETSCWALGGGTNVGFWERRMVIETGVHRWDAYDAHGEADRLLDVVAGLGLDEFGALWWPQLGDVQPLELHARDLDRSYVFGEAPMSTVEADASELYLRLMGRRSSVELPDDWATAVDGLGKPPKR